MREIDVLRLENPPADANYAIMKKSAIGFIDICEYYVTFYGAIDGLMDLPTANYTILKIRR